MARTVDTSYGGDGAVTTRMSREGLDLGPAPNFWGDLDAISKRFAKAPAAATQASALRAPTPAPYQTGPMFESGGDSAHSAAAPVSPVDYSNWTPRSFGHPSMSPQGVIGTYVNPMDVPLSLQGAVPTGYFTDDSHTNYTYSPTVNRAAYATGATQRERGR